MKENRTPEQTATLHAFRARSQADALERMNRITGLQFETQPKSLITEVGGLTLAEEDGEELVHRALSLWDAKEEEENKKK